jgi:diguanylate cyclase (GGDEF)-like protein
MLLPLLNSSLNSTLPSAGVDELPEVALQRHRLFGYLVISCLVFLGLIVVFTPNSDQWLAVILSTATLVGAVLTLVNTAFNRTTDQINRLQYKLKLTETKLDRLKIKYNDACQLDELTGCHNQQYFVEQCQRSMAMSTRSKVCFSVAVIHIDQYVQILSHEGHRGGAEILKIFGNVLHCALREVDVVAHLDDERFALLLSDSIDEGAMTVTDRIMTLARQVHPHDDEKSRITVSVGVTNFRDQPDVKSLLSEADTALDLAIREGGDRVAAYLVKESVAA